MLVRYITMYCFEALRRKDLDPVEQNALFMEARDLFRKAGKSGQAGEMLIYFLLEAVLKAPQALRKMPLSTNPKEERKGSDGVHIKWNSDLQILDLFFAEAKIWATFSTALDDVFASVKKFHEGGMKQHELNLLTNHFTALDDDTQEKILSYIDGENAPNTRVTHAALVGFDWEEYKALDDARRKQFVAEFESRYKSWAAATVPKVSSKLSKFEYKNLRFEFFFIPFKDVQKFRDWFEEALRG
jgi:hypothetical protein